MSENTAHTSGPWRVDESERGFQVWDGAGRGAICTVYTHNCISRPNAHLIAAAPEMYDALVACEKFMEALHFSSPEWSAESGVTGQMISDVLSKARGE